VPVLGWAESWPQRIWAIENANGLGWLLSRQLLEAGEQVRDASSGDLSDISVETELVEHRVVFVEGDRGVRPLVGIDPDHDRHEGSFHQ
jgi:hypothetical protein